MMIYRESNDSLVNMRNRLVYLEDLQNKKSTKSLFEILEKATIEIIKTLTESGIRRTIFKIRCQLNKKLLYDKREHFDYKDTENQLNYKCHKDYQGKKVAIYTAIYGDYDTLKEPLYVNPQCDYFAFTNQDIPTNSIWKKGNEKLIPDFSTMDSYHASKYIKLHPHILFSDYDYSIWVDGTTTIVADLLPFIDVLESKNKVIGMFDNPVHDCIYTEANFLLYYNRAPEDLLLKQIATYSADGYPKHNGMFECTIIARKHNELLCKSLMEQWWYQTQKYTMRDQISFPYVLWKNNMCYEDVAILGLNRNYCLRVTFDNHLKTKTYNK